MRLSDSSSSTHVGLALLAGALFVVASAPAQAGGFEVPDNGVRALGRGGAYAVGARDLTALHYNPGALARLEGSQAMWHHNLVFHESTYTRATLDPGWLDDGGTSFDTVSDSEKLFWLGGFLAASIDLGDLTDSDYVEDITIALGVYGPSSVGTQSFPDYGPQSFMFTEADLILVYYSLAVAWQIPDTFGVGVTLQWVDLSKMEYELVVDSAPTTGAASLDPIAAPDGGRLLTKMQLQDRTGFTAQIGLWWRPVEWLEFGVAGRIIPVDLRPEGGVTVDQPTLITSELSVSMELTLPIQLRGGLRYIHTDDEGEEVFDLEIDVFWENWSVIDEYYVQMDGEISAQAVEDIVMPKAWQDTVAVRVGADWRAVPDLLTVRAGGFYETGAVPQNYTHLDFPSFERGGVGLGFTFDVGPVSLSAGYMHVFQEDRNVSELKAKVFAQRPLRPCPENCDGINGVPSNAGSYKTSFDILSFGIDLHWGRFLADDDEDTDHTLEGLPPAEAEPEREPEPEPAPAEPVPPRAEDAGTPDPDTPDPDTPDPDTPDPDTPDADEPTEAPAEEPPGARR